MESKMNVDDVGGDEKRDKAKAPISPDPKPGTEASISKVAQDDGDASLNANRQPPTATPGGGAALPDSGAPEVLACPITVAAYFNDLSAFLVHCRITVDEFWAIREKVDKVLRKCGH